MWNWDSKGLPTWGRAGAWDVLSGSAGGSEVLGRREGSRGTRREEAEYGVLGTRCAGDREVSYR